MRPDQRRGAPPTSIGPKIIVQYRQKSAKVYEVESNGSALEVRICHADEAALLNGWRVDARARFEHAAPIEAWGTTAADALSEVARMWNARGPAPRIFDWEAIARLLHGVQAI